MTPSSITLAGFSIFLTGGLACLLNLAVVFIWAVLFRRHSKWSDTPLIFRLITIITGFTMALGLLILALAVFLNLTQTGRNIL